VVVLVSFAALSTAGAFPADSRGTILMALRRPGFVILGADRQWSTKDDSGRPIPGGTHRKFVLHDTLPLAVVFRGLAALVPGPRLSYDLVKGPRLNTYDLVKDAVRTIVSVNQPDPIPPLVATFEAALSFHVQETRAAFRADLTRRGLAPTASQEIMSHAKLGLLVGFYANGRAVLL